MTYEYANGVTLGAIQIDNHEQHFVKSQGKPAITKLAIELQWNSTDSSHRMRSPIVRGAPYTSMIYEHGTLPRIYSERPLKRNEIIIDNGKTIQNCGVGRSSFSEPFLVESDMKILLDQSDMTWLIFVSSPIYFKCSTYDAAKETYKLDLAPGVVMDIPSIFDLQAVSYAAENLMVRLAMSNNCTSGQNPQCKFFDMYSTIFMLIVHCHFV